MTAGSSLVHFRELERMEGKNKLESDLRVTADFRGDCFKGASPIGTVTMPRDIGRILSRSHVGGNATRL
jgi:hypothetical protein